MKDPLQPTRTPYEVLGLERGADAARIEAAFRQTLGRGGNARELLVAKQTLQRPAERILIDVFHYEPRWLGQLSPSPIDDDSVLQPSERALTALTWEEQLQAAFPNVPVIHSLAVLWYWWAVHEQADPSAHDGSSSGAPAVAEMWELAIAFWTMLASSDVFWLDPLGPGSELRTEVARLIEARLRAGLESGEASCRARGDLETAGRYAALGFALTNELRTAEALRAAGIQVGNGSACCGPLLLRQVGLLAGVSREVREALLREPNNGRLVWLRDSLSPVGAMAALLDQGKPDAALEALDSARVEVRDSPEARELRARAFLLRGRQKASLGRLDEALDDWEDAFDAEGSDETEDQIRSEIVAACRERAAALAATQLDEAIELLERAHGLTDDEKVQETLAEFRTRRGLETLNDAMSGAAEDGDRLVPALELGLADLERAASLGSSNAREQAETVRAMLEHAKAGVLGAPPEIVDALAEANRAAERGDWDAAVAGLEDAIAVADGDARDALERNLAVCLTNRAMAACDRAMKNATPDEDTRRHYVMQQLATFFAGGATGETTKSERPWWRPRLPRFSATGLLWWAALLSFIWLPALLYGLGVVNETTAGNIFWGLLITIWVGGQLVIPFLVWIWSAISNFLDNIPKFDARTGYYGSSYSGSVDLPECQVTGCTLSASYEIDVGKILNPSSTVDAKMRVCATHSQELERIVNVVPAKPETVAALRVAKADLEQAAKLDPGQPAVKENLRQVNELLEHMLPARAGGR